MKKKNLMPIQTTPVERDNPASSRDGEKGLKALNFAETLIWGDPFAGDDAE